MQEPLLPTSDQTAKPTQTVKSKKWIFLALLAGFGLGYGNYFVACIESQGTIALSYVGLIAYIILMGYKLSQCWSNKRAYGTYVNYKKSNFFDHYQQFRYKQIIPLLANGLTNIVYLIAMIYAFQFAKISGINQGVILALNSLCSVYNILIFYAVYREKISLSQFFGIVLMLTCVALLNINGHTKPESEDGVNKRYYAFLSLACGLVSPLFLSLKHIVIRIYKAQYNTWDMAIDGLILEYQIYIVLAVYYIFIIGDINWIDLMYGSIASLFLIIGKISIALAVSTGLAGPAASLANTNVLHMTFLTTVFSSQALSGFEISGVCAGILGATVISTGDLIIKKLKKN